MLERERLCPHIGGLQGQSEGGGMLMSADANQEIGVPGGKRSARLLLCVMGLPLLLSCSFSSRSALCHQGIQNRSCLENTAQIPEPNAGKLQSRAVKCAVRRKRGNIGHDVGRAGGGFRPFISGWRRSRKDQVGGGGAGLFFDSVHYVVNGFAQTSEFRIGIEKRAGWRRM